jgi:hypothetical protein
MSSIDLDGVGPPRADWWLAAVVARDTVAIPVNGYAL